MDLVTDLKWGSGGEKIERYQDTLGNWGNDGLYIKIQVCWKQFQPCMFEMPMK